MTHGDSDDCGRLQSYALNPDGFPFCKACGCPFEGSHPEFPVGTLVRHTRNAAICIWGPGARGMPKDGQVVGVADSLPLVRWCDGHLVPVNARNIERLP